MKNSVGTTEKIKTEESEDNKMKNLKTLQTLSKMGKILSRIAFVFARIGACGCIIGLLSCSYGAELSGSFRIQLKYKPALGIWGDVSDQKNFVEMQNPFLIEEALNSG